MIGSACGCLAVVVGVGAYDPREFDVEDVEDAVAVVGVGPQLPAVGVDDLFDDVTDARRGRGRGPLPSTW